MTYLTYGFKKWVVVCPKWHEETHVGVCADICDFYEGDGSDETGLECSYE